ncbi:hypothetical protein LTS10_010076 [Elasticomyces elasticus]|nr:hypothetical protein LTS10_010076 [Elasticomyces elasticus]
MDLSANAPVNPRMAARSAMPGLAEPTTPRDWMRKTTLSKEQQRSEVSQGLQHQQELEHTIALLRRQQARRTTIDPDLADTIDKLERSSKGLNAYFSIFLDPIIYNEMQPLDHRPSGSTSAAVKVLELPELLEEVLGYVDTADILHFHQVNQSARALINGSPRLRTTLGFRAAPEGSRSRLPFLSTTALSPMIANFEYSKHSLRQEEPIKLETVPTSGLHQVRLRADFRVSPGKAAKIDERCRDMYITQPPVTYARVLLACCSLKQQSIQSDAGITIGMLWDARLELLEEHKLCPHAALELHDADGFITAEPSFTIDVLVPTDGSVLPVSQRGVGRYAPHPRLSRGALARIKAYMTYKMDAFKNGEEIETLMKLDAAGRLDKYESSMRQREQLLQQHIVAHGAQPPVFNMSNFNYQQHIQGYNGPPAQPPMPMPIQNQIQNYVQHQSQMIQALQAATGQQQQQNTTQGSQAVQPPVTQQHGSGQQINNNHTSSAIAQIQAQYVQQQQMMAAAAQHQFTPFAHGPTLPLPVQQQQTFTPISLAATGYDSDDSDDSDGSDLAGS